MRNIGKVRSAWVVFSPSLLSLFRKIMGRLGQLVNKFGDLVRFEATATGKKVSIAFKLNVHPKFGPLNSVLNTPPSNQRPSNPVPTCASEEYM